MSMNNSNTAAPFDSPRTSLLTAKCLVVMVDNGLLRENEAEDVRKTLTEHFGVNLTVVDATDRFLADLKGVTDPEQKRKIIGKMEVAIDVG